MKRKHLVTKTLAIVLSAALCVGGTGIETYASSVELSQSETEEVQTGKSELQTADTVSANDTDTTGTNGETAADSEEITDTEETDTDAEKDAEDTEKTAEENDLDADEAFPMPADGTLVKNVCKDQRLVKAIIAIYNAEKNTKYTDEEFNVGMLKAYDGAFDFSLLNASYEVDQITDITGLGCALAASMIDISTTNVKTIPTYEFNSCSQLQTIKFPATLETIGSYAFVSCSALTSIELPDTLQSIGKFAFNKCASLSQIVSVAGSVTMADTLPSGLKTIETNAFDGCAALRKVIIPSYENGSILQNATSLFANCTSLETVEIGKRITIIPLSAFENSGCAGGMQVTFQTGSQLDKIMQLAFSGASMASIDLSPCTKLTQIEYRAFKASSSAEVMKLAEIKMPVEIKNDAGEALVMELGNEVFYQDPLKKMYIEGNESDSVTIPDYIVEIGVAAFAENSEMTELVLSANLKDIPDYAFNECTNLEKVTQHVVGNNCATRSIGTCAFRKTGFTDASFIGQMNNLVRIGGEDQHLTVVENRDKEGYGTIVEPKYNKNYLLKKGKFGSEVFTQSKVQTVVLPASIEVIESRAFYDCPDLESVTFTSGRKEKDKTCKIESEAFRQCVNLVTAILPENKGIGENLEIGTLAFLRCPLTAVAAADANTGKTQGTFPVTLSKLADNAFDSCNLPDVIIQGRENGQNVEIGEYVFRNNSNIQKVQLPETTETVQKGMFYDSGVKEFSTAGTTKNLKKIDDYAFFGNAFDTLDLSAYHMLESIGSRAFAFVDLPKNYRSGRLGIQKIIMPAKVDSGKLKLGDYPLQGALRFTTMQIKNDKNEYNEDKVVWIPDYISNDNCGAGAFSVTSVQETKWQYTKTGVNPWTYIPASMYNNCAVTDIAKCLLPEKDLTAIQTEAFLGCLGLQKIDISKYTKLTDMGTGVFADCFNLETAVLPQELKTLPDYTFMIGRFNKVTTAPEYYSSLKAVDLGGVTELGKYCFAAVNMVADESADKGGSGTGQGAVWGSVLPSVDLSHVTKIGEGAFYGATSLQTVKFGEGLTEIGARAFQSCAMLNLKGDCGLPDSLASIGDYAFYRCEALDTVAFGTKLNTIGKYAFAETTGHYTYQEADAKTGQIKPVTPSDKYFDCTDTDAGLQSVDFTNAISLATIGEGAFYTSNIKKFELLNSKVKTLNTKTLADCPMLDSVHLGNSLQVVAQNSMSGCAKLTTVNICPTTTMNKRAFYATSRFANAAKSNTAIADRYGSTGTKKSLTVAVEAEDVTTIGTGGETTFPYYVMPYDANNDKPAFADLLIGNPDSPDSVEEYLQVEGRVSSYYYKKVRNDANNRVSSEYFTKSDSAITYTTDAGQKVETIKIRGLKPMAAGETVEFVINTSFEFERQEKDLDPISCTFATTYHLHIESIPYRSVLYTDNNRTKEESLTWDLENGTAASTQTIRASRKKSTYNQNYYYTLESVKPSLTRPETCNLIIESSDPTVIAIAGAAKLVTGSTNKWKLDASAYGKNVETAWAATKGKSFSVSAKKPGTATVKIYPEGSPAQTITMTYNVMADIQKITLTAPREITNGVRPGDTFNVLNSVTTYLGQMVSKDKNTLGTLSQLTDNTITYTSSDPKILTVDQQGNVTVQNVTAEKQKVRITASAKTPDGDKVEGYVDLNIAYPPMKSGAEAKDSTGAAVKIKTAGSTTKQGEVSYTKPAEGVTNVTIPATVVVDGVTCKVTEVSADAFKGNKTVQNVTIQADVTTLPNDMFKGCTNLQTAALPSGITSIPSGMFNGCGKLKTIKIPGKVTEIGANAFKNCKALTKITIPKPVKTIGNSAFSGCSKLKTVTFHKKAVLTTIGNSVFSGCKAMKAISLPKKLESIGSKAFYNCGKLKTIKIQSTVLKKVGKNAFKGIYKKATIKVPKKKLGEYKNLLKKKGQSSKVKIKK